MKAVMDSIDHTMLSMVELVEKRKQIVKRKTKRKKSEKPEPKPEEIPMEVEPKESEPQSVSKPGEKKPSLPTLVPMKKMPKVEKPAKQQTEEEPLFGLKLKKTETI